jgi:RNA polymerase sigma factor (sigma-70 family)
LKPQDAFEQIRSIPRDSESWGVLYLYMHSQLLAYLSAIIYSFGLNIQNTGEDIVHDVLLKFFEKWPELSSRLPSLAAVEVYLKRSCRNLLVDRYRQDQTSQQFVHFTSARFSEAFGGEVEVYRKLFVEEILSLVSPPCAQILRAYIEEDLTPAELAEREGQSPSTFYNRWYRCIESIKAILSTKGAL